MGAFYNVEHSSTRTKGRGSVAIQSIERAAAILRALAGGSRRLGVSELSDRLGLAKGTVHGLLARAAGGGVRRAGSRERQVPAGRVAAAAGQHLPRRQRAARPRAAPGPTTWPSVRARRCGWAPAHGDGVLVIHHVFRPDNTLQILEVGSHLPLHATALGKVLLAYRGDCEPLPQNGLTRLTRATLTTPDELERGAGRGARERLGRGA